MRRIAVKYQLTIHDADNAPITVDRVEHLTEHVHLPSSINRDTGPALVDFYQATVIVWHRRYLIGGLTLAIAVVVFAASLLLTKRYESSAIITFTRPMITNTFSGRVQVNHDVLIDAGQGFAALARSDTQLRRVRQHGREVGLIPDTMSQQAFSDGCSARTIGESLLRLSVKAESPGAAAALANYWAKEVTRHFTNLYGVNQQKITEIELQVTLAKDELDNLQKTLLESIAETRAETLKSRLKQASNAVTAYRDKINGLCLLETEAKRVLDQLNATEPADKELEWGLALAILGLHSYNTAALEQRRRVQVHVGEQSVAATPVKITTARQGLNELLAAWQTQRDNLSEQLAHLDDTVQMLTVDLEKARHKLWSTISQRDRGKQRVDVLADQQQQLQLMMSDQMNQARVAAEAVQVEKPVGPAPALFAIAAAALAFSLSAGGCVIRAKK